MMSTTKRNGSMNPSIAEGTNLHARLCGVASGLEPGHVSTHAMSVARRMICLVGGDVLEPAISSDVMARRREAMIGVATQHGGTSRMTMPGTASMLVAPPGGAMVIASRVAQNRLGVAAVVAAALTAGEVWNVDPQRVVAGVAIGLEYQARLTRSTAESEHDGWDLDSVAGTVAAAMAAAYSRGLDSEGIAHSVGIATSSTVGLRYPEGCDAGRWQVAKAASNAVFATMLAGEGTTASPVALETPRGYFGVLFGGFDPTVFDDFGTVWLVGTDGDSDHLVADVTPRLQHETVEERWVLLDEIRRMA